ncbi:hypothetical protein CVT26_011587 [Gymnopilus dilepis]|uniref:Blue (type 1) copper domain-containing protein n=1 Tax=Gymnopilus dilepis TaxID=231916 RepID=A0A409VXW5_9AGAR|nr:hypothetical protein CVT26_011587 [Gymnopilus dilepis]
MLFSALSALALLTAASAQMTVQVGSTASAPGGIFQFIPNNITAPKGTVITFQFSGVPGNHSVTQSTFADPCDPVAGGFDSGLVQEPTTPSQTPEFNLTITDDTKPIWFFCKQLLPSPHCGVGMVGAINAPTNGSNTFAAFQTNAMNFGKNSGQGQGGLVGIGASASASVGPIPSGVTVLTGTPVGSATGSGSASSATNTSPAGSSPASPSPTNSATGLVASSLVATLAAAVVFILV